MAPGDLNLKKSWNPALIKNQTKIWKQEQKQLDEFKKIKEKQAEYEQEKNDLELLSLKYKNKDSISKTDKLKLSKMDWMYEGPEVLGGTSGDNATKSVATTVSVVDDKSNEPKDEMRSEPKHTVAKLAPKSSLKRTEIDLLDPMSQIKKQMMMAKRDRTDRVDKHRHGHKHGHRHKEHAHGTSSHRDRGRDRDSDRGRDDRTHREGRHKDNTDKSKLSSLY